MLRVFSSKHVRNIHIRLLTMLAPRLSPSQKLSTELASTSSYDPIVLEDLVRSVMKLNKEYKDLKFDGRKSNEKTVVLGNLSKLGLPSAKQVQIRPPTSSSILSTIVKTGSLEDIIVARTYLSPISDAKSNYSLPLQLSADDYNNMIEFCINQKAPYEAICWFHLMDMASVGATSISNGNLVRPNAKTFNTLIPAVAKTRDWENLFYLVGDMKLQGFYLSEAAVSDVLEECSRLSTTRWKYARNFFVEFFASRLTAAFHKKKIDVSKSDRDIASSFYPSQLAAKTLNIVLRGATLVESNKKFMKASAAGAGKVLQLWKDLESILAEKVAQAKSVDSSVNSSVSDQSVPPPMRPDDAALIPLSLAATLLDRPDILLSFLADHLELPTRQQLPYNAITERKLTDEVFSVMISAEKLWTRPGLLGAYLLFLLSKRLPDEVYATWKRVQTAFDQFDFDLRAQRYSAQTLSSPDSDPYGEVAVASLYFKSDAPDRRAEALETICRSIHRLDLPIDRVMAVADFARFVVLGDGTSSDYECQVPMTPSLSEALVNVFGRVRQSEAASMVFLMCESQSILMPQRAFLIMSQMLYLEGDSRLTVRLLHKYLSLHSSKTAGENYTQPKIQRNEEHRSWSPSLYASSASIPTPSTSHLKLLPQTFVPAIKALSTLGEVDALVTLLTEELPARGIEPSYAHVLIAMDSLRQAEQYERAVDIFFTFFAPSKTPREKHSFKKLKVSSRKQKGIIKKSHKQRLSSDNPLPDGEGGDLYDSSSNAKSSGLLEPRLDLSIDPNASAELTALFSCAKGKLGEKALTILSMLVSRTDIDPNLIMLGNEMRCVELAIQALGTKDNVVMLPNLLHVTMSSGTQNRALLPSGRLILLALSLAAKFENVEVATQVLRIAASCGVDVDKEMVFGAAHLAALPEGRIFSLALREHEKERVAGTFDEDFLDGFAVHDRDDEAVELSLIAETSSSLEKEDEADAASENSVEGLDSKVARCRFFIRGCMQLFKA